MAEIFLAKTFTELGTERLCAIKRILPFFSNDSSFGEMLISEAKLCAKLSHGNVVQTYELGNNDGLYFIAEEYVEGFDLNQLLGQLARARIALPLQFAIYIIIETLRALDYAHRLCDQDGEPFAIIHRDVSPTNVLISTEGEIKLCDFGIAKATLGDLEVESIDEYHLKGKVAYMSPEYLNGEQIDHRSDLYATGILLWELLAGRRLYKTKDEEETLRKAKAAEVPAIKNRGFPEYELINALVIRALSKDPANRFQTGQEFIRALDDYMHVSGLVVSQLKFADFLMANFGERLRKQRIEREQSLADLEEYQKKLNGEHSGELVLVSQADDDRAEALLATFSAPHDDPLFDEETQTEAEKGAEEVVLLEDEKEEVKPIELTKQQVKDTETEDRAHIRAYNKDAETRGRFRSSAPPDMIRRLPLVAWLGIAAAIATTAVVLYSYFAGFN